MTLHIKVLGGGCANCANLERTRPPLSPALALKPGSSHVDLGVTPATACSPRPAW